MNRRNERSSNCRSWPAFWLAAALAFASPGVAQAEPTVVAQRGGLIGDVVMHGDFTYVRQGSSIVTLRLDGKGETLGVSAVYGPLGARVLDLAVHQDRLYASWAGASWDDSPPDVTLSVFSLADPSRPARLGELDLPGDEPLRAGDMMVLGDVLYVLADDELLPIDLSDPDRPIAGSPAPFPGSNLMPYDENHLVAWGFAFALPPAFYSSVFDVSAPLAPVAVSSFFSFQANDGVASGDGLLVGGTYSGFAVFDLSDLSAPQQVATVDGPEGGGVLLGRTYLVGDDDQIRVFDLSDPENPVERAPLPLGFGEMRRSDREGDRLMFLTSDARAAVLDVSAPQTPVLGPVADLPQGTALGGVRAVGSQIYVSDLYRGLRLADGKMEVVADLGADWPLVDVPSVDGNRALLADGTAFHLLDVTSPEAPVLLGSVPVERARLPLLDGDRGWGMGRVAFQDWRLVSLDLSSPSAPVADLSTNFFYNSSLRVRGDTLYAAVFGPDGSGLHIFDVSGAVPVEIGHYAGCQAEDVDVRGGVAALACGPAEELHLLDIADPADPVLLGVFSDAQLEDLQAVLFAVDDPGRVYLGYRDAIDVVDVSDPSRPVLASRLRVGGRIRQLVGATGGGLWATGLPSGIARIDEVRPALGSLDQAATRTLDLKRTSPSGDTER